MSRPHGERGFALVAVMLLTMMVFLTAGMVLMPSLQGRAFSARTGIASQAANTTEAAVDYTLAALNSQVPTGSNSALRPLPTFFRAVSGQANTWGYNDGANGWFFRSNLGASPNVTVRIPTVVPVPNGPGVASNYRIITADTTDKGARKRMQAIVYMEQNAVLIPYVPFARAITARGNLTPNGNDDTIRTDSYNSGHGPYGGGNVDSNGGVHVNGSILDGAVYAGNVTVSGTVAAGVSVSGTNDDGVPNTLETGVPPEDIPDTPVAPVPTRAVVATTPSTVTPAPGEVINLGAVNLTGNAAQVLTLMPGRYVCSSISITGNASIMVAGGGLVEIFCTGAIDAAGNGIANASAKPTNLVINATNPAAPVSIAGNGTFYGGVRAPGNNVTIAGNGAFYGAIIGNNVVYNGTNSVVHYDEAMGEMPAEQRMANRPAYFRTIALNVLDRQ